jgi:hypothetical protein
LIFVPCTAHAASDEPTTLKSLLTPDFRMASPMITVPRLVDGGYTIR